MAHLEAQQGLDDEDRLTHLTTALRHPPLPPGRGTPDPRAHLRFRIDPELRVAAEALGYFLPGQSRRHGHHDYAARPLTDTVLVAIHQAHPFVVADLENLPQVLSRRVALGLWRLAVAATLTEAETQALWASDEPLLAVILEEEEVAWHHPWRFAVAHHILATLLAEDDADEWMGMLESQTGQYQTLLGHLQQRHPDAAWLQADLHLLDTHHQSVQGRGGTAVWRAQRSVAMTRIAEWLTNPEGMPELELGAPEWKLHWPEEWTKACFKHGDAVPPHLDDYAADGRVMLITEGSKKAYWPLTPTGGPVPQFAGCLAAGLRLEPARLAEVVLLDEHLPPAGIPVGLAQQLGFITEPERNTLIATANANNATMIATVLSRAAKRLDTDELAELNAATSNPRKFVRIANRHHLRAWYYNPWWRWDVTSVIEGIRQEHSPDRIEALTTAYIDLTAYILEMDMSNAWQRAFWLGYAHPD